MERNLIINEYVQLRTYLNKSNRLANEKTSLDFFIRKINQSEYQLFAFVNGVAEEHKIALAARDRFRNWERTGFTPFKNLENFCANLLNKKEKIDNSEHYLFLTDDQMAKLTQTIQNKFTNLDFD